jgi:multicomponent K+:H+ antiporter subunit D
MSHGLIAPILLPLLTAVLLVLQQELGHAGRGRRGQRRLSVAAAVAFVVLGAWLVARAHGAAAPEVYRVGALPGPFGIVLVLDRLSALLVLLTGLLALGSLLHAMHHDSDRRAHYFHPLFHLQVTGVAGAFLTGDLFNLFVFFEVLLIASYCLLVYGGTEPRVRAGLHYVTLNLLGSSLFLLAAGTLYGVTGTLNMAELAVRVAALPPADAGLVRAGGLLLLVVFALKAAVVPLHFWLPDTYAAANAAVAALFAIMTKVGVYAIVRVHTLVFGPEAGEAALVAAPWLLPAALGTLALGALGALGSRRLRPMQGYLLVMSVGTMLAPVALFDAAALGAGLYYLAHSTLTSAAMFLIADLVARQRGGVDDELVRGPAVARPALLGALFGAGAVAVVGGPPLSGFLGKALILAAAPADGRGWWLWGVTLGGSLVALVALARAGSMLFWNTFRDRDDDPFDPVVHAPLAAQPVNAAAIAPAAGLLALVVALTLLAGPVTAYTSAAAGQIVSPRPYIDAVLGEPMLGGARGAGGATGGTGAAP